MANHMLPNSNLMVDSFIANARVEEYVPSPLLAILSVSH